MTGSVRKEFKMNDPKVMLGVFNIAIAILIVALSIPLVMRKIKMNRFYGIRIPKSFSSETNWLEINAYGGKQLMLWSTLPLVAGIICFFVNVENANRGIAPLLLGVLPVMLMILIVLVQTVRFANKLKK